jgi:hypothetical protein
MTTATDSDSDSIWADHAARLISLYGHTEARRLCIKDRDNNSPGTATYAFLNATLKYLERAAKAQQ